MAEFKNPKDLLDAYNNGFVGGYCDPEELIELLGKWKYPLFGAAAYKLEHSGAGKLSLPFLSLEKFNPGFGQEEKQTTGDCVSHGTRTAIDLSRSIEIDIKGEPESFVAPGATEAIYQSRQGMGEGMTCSGAAKYVTEIGGVLIRKKYDGIDLSVYDSSIGSRKRIPQNIYQNEAAKHPVKTASLISSVTEARDALANGYGIAACSDVGFTSVRDNNGISPSKGVWYHCMAWIACDDTRELFDETLFLVQNSWGIWNGGPKRHNQPEGSFWIRQRDAERILSQRGSFVFSNVEGFPARQLPNYGLGEWV